MKWRVHPERELDRDWWVELRVPELIAGCRIIDGTTAAALLSATRERGI